MRSRISEEQIDEILAGKSVTIDQEQVLHLLKFSIPTMPLLITKYRPGVFNVVSVNRADPKWKLAHPDEEPENVKARMEFAASQLPPEELEDERPVEGQRF